MKRLQRKKRMDKRGEMGIGTLIIFIAMVLVASVAATVLISTANELQMQAYSTARDALADVSTGFNVISVWGDRGKIGEAIDDHRDEDILNAIQTLELKVKLQAGSPPIDLENMIIDISDGNIAASLAFNTDSTTNWDQSEGEDPSHLNANGVWDYSDGCLNAHANNSNSQLTNFFTAQVLMDPDEHNVFQTSHVMTEGTLVKLYINCNDTGLNLNNQQQVTMKLCPKHGIQSLVKFTTPSVYADERFTNLH